MNERQVAEKAVDLHSDFPLMNAVISGKQEGKIFAAENTYFIIHKAGFSLLKAGKSFANFKALIECWTYEKNIPKYFHVYNAPPDLINECKASELVNTSVRTRIKLKFTGNRLPANK